MTSTGTAGPAHLAGGADGGLAIRTVGLTKRFGHQAAVDGIDLAVPRGSVFGFLGPNGSGKTTTIRVMLGLAAATSGEVEVLGQPMPRSFREVLPRVGALVEGPAFYPFLSGAANLARLDSADPLSAPATRPSRVAEALDRVGLEKAGRKKVRAYSLGMKQRLGIANALLNPRDLLVLDEPTNGLDPQGTREVRTLIRNLAAGGTTVFVSSHLLAEVAQICTHAAIMSAGSLVAQGTLGELRRGGRALVTITTPDVDRAAGVLRQLGLEVAPLAAGPPGVGRPAAPQLPAQVSAPMPEDPRLADAPELIVAALVAADVRVRGFAVEGASLEERFVELTGEGFHVAQ